MGPIRRLLTSNWNTRFAGLSAQVAEELVGRLEVADEHYAIEKV
jgi:hypothetical protein